MANFFAKIKEVCHTCGSSDIWYLGPVADVYVCRTCNTRLHILGDWEGYDVGYVEREGWFVWKKYDHCHRLVCICPDPYSLDMVMYTLTNCDLSNYTIKL